MSLKHKMSYKYRFEKFREGVCPYCGADGATLEKTKRGYHGQCVVCMAQNNFSHPEVRARVAE